MIHKFYLYLIYLDIDRDSTWFFVKIRFTDIFSSNLPCYGQLVLIKASACVSNIILRYKKTSLNGTSTDPMGAEYLQQSRHNKTWAVELDNITPTL